MKRKRAYFNHKCDGRQQAQEKTRSKHKENHNSTDIRGLCLLRCHLAKKQWVNTNNFSRRQYPKRKYIPLHSSSHSSNWKNNHHHHHHVRLLRVVIRNRTYKTLKSLELVKVLSLIHISEPTRPY